MAHASRRDFLKTGLTATLLAGGGVVPARAARRSATDLVTLGRSGVQVTRLALGTGTFSGRAQREIGQEGFTRLVRYAYDNGIRFFETAESYAGMPEMLAIALKGIPRDSYKLMTKYSARGDQSPQEKIDQFRKQLNSEYFDILLIHCVRSPNWPTETERLQDAFSEAKSKKVILSHGASVHGLQALAAFPGNKWLDIAMIRMNHAGVHMDTPLLRDSADLGDVDQVVERTKKVHSEGMGVISMKLAGEGQFTTPEQREAAMKFAMNLGAVDSVTLGFRKTSEIDETIERMNRVMNA